MTRFIPPLAMLLALFIAAPPLQAQPEPSLTAELEAAIEQGGAEALQKRFDEIWPEHRDEYTVDMDALSRMLSEQAQSGDTKMIGTLAEISAVVMQAEMEQQLAESPAMAAQMEAMHQARAEKEAREARETAARQEDAAKAARPQQAEPRNDLERFTGVFGDPKNPDSHRKLFVSQTCDGHLLIGAMWGDVAPWRMHSVSEYRFGFSDDFTDFDAEFSIAADGQAETMSHTLEWIASPLLRTGDLPADWQDCIPAKER